MHKHAHNLILSTCYPLESVVTISTHTMQQHLPGTQTYLHPALPNFLLLSQGRSSAAASMASTPALASDAYLALGTPKSAGHSPPACCYFTETQKRSRVSLELAEKAGEFLPPSSACLCLLDPQLLPCCCQSSTQSQQVMCQPTKSWETATSDTCGLSRVCKAQGQAVTTPKPDR